MFSAPSVSKLSEKFKKKIIKSLARQVVLELLIKKKNAWPTEGFMQKTCQFRQEVQFPLYNKVLKVKPLQIFQFTVHEIKTSTSQQENIILQNILRENCTPNQKLRVYSK